MHIESSIQMLESAIFQWLMRRGTTSCCEKGEKSYQMQKILSTSRSLMAIAKAGFNPRILFQVNDLCHSQMSWTPTAGRWFCTKSLCQRYVSCLPCNKSLILLVKIICNLFPTKVSINYLGASVIKQCVSNQCKINADFYYMLKAFHEQVEK